MFFHAGFNAFSGGFVGVDVFFVISGYLITSIILHERHAGTFTLAGFYERRARRILPALFFVIFACIPFAWLWMLPSELKAFSKSLIAVSVFASNVLFWQDTGYFNSPTELIPLLHTWSLAIEEQYYLLFPIFLMLTWRLPKRYFVGLLVLVAMASLAAAQWGSVSRPDATFFLLPTRGWELLIGVFIALHLADGSINGAVKAEEGRGAKVGKDLASLAGLLLIAYSVHAYSRSTPFPSFRALVPTLGTALIILCATPATLVGKLLGNNLLVGVGLISYSGYLWHQPLLAFARFRGPDDPGTPLLLFLPFMALGLAYPTWRFVERPFRDRQRMSRARIFVLALVCTGVTASLGLVGYFGDGFPNRKLRDGTPMSDLEFKVRTNYGLHETCEGKFTLSAHCRTSTEPELLVWGDSFAMHLVDGFLASKPGLGVIQMTKSNCGPLVGLAPATTELGDDWARDCIEFNDAVVGWIRSSKTLKHVVLASAFSSYASPGSTFMLRDGTLRSGPEVALASLLSTLDMLAESGIQPIVFAPPPLTGANLGRCLRRSKFFALKEDRCDIAPGEAHRLQSDVIGFLERVGKHHRVVRLADGVCDSSACRAAVGDIWIYRDSGHLSHEGSAYLGRKMDFYKLIFGQR